MCSCDCCLAMFSECPRAALNNRGSGVSGATLAFARASLVSLRISSSTAVIVNFAFGSSEATTAVQQSVASKANGERRLMGPPIGRDVLTGTGFSPSNLPHCPDAWQGQEAVPVD